MAFSLHQYRDTQTEMLEQIDKLHNLLHSRNDQLRLEQLLQIKQQLMNEQFLISVVGEFSNGKSAFINAMLGKRILPSLSRPATTILNVVSYSEKPEIKLHFRKEKKKPQVITEEEFKKIVALREPTSNCEKKQYRKEMEYLHAIEFAEIAQPLSFCKDGVRIIDTPGTNDLDPNRDKLTNHIIPQSDVAIIVLKAIPLLSESEKSFITDRLLKNDINKIFIVINFKDQLKTEEEERKVLGRAYEELSHIFEHPKVFLLTALHALNARRIANGEQFKGDDTVLPLEETGFLEFERELASFLQYDRGFIKLQRFISNIVKLIESTKVDIKRERFGLTNNIQNLNDKIAGYKDELKETRSLANDAINLISINFLVRWKNLTSTYKELLSELPNTANLILTNNLHLSDEDLFMKIESAIAPIERTHHQKKMESISVIVQHVISTSSEKLNEKWGKIEIGLEQLYSETSITEAGEPYGDSLKKYDQDLFSAIYTNFWLDYHSSQGFFKKAIAATGMVITGLVSFFTRRTNTREDRIRRQIHHTFETSRRSKESSLRKELDSIQQFVVKEYRNTINEKIVQAEKQLQRLQRSTRLEQDEITKRWQEIEVQANDLELIEQRLIDCLQLYMESKEAVRI